MTNRNNQCANKKCRNPATEDIQFEEAMGPFISERVCGKCAKLHELIQAASSNYYSVTNVENPVKFVREKEEF